MISLNDYLYNGDTVLKILRTYAADLRKDALKNHNQIDLLHSNFLIGYTELLEHNDFLTSQSQRIREFYKYLADKYPFLAFTVNGRIKSLIRAEEKFNAYIIDCVYDYYKEHGTYPPISAMKESVNRFKDLIAYRIVISLPKCHLKPGDDRNALELKYLYQIANVLPEFLEEREFTAELSGISAVSASKLLNDEVKPYFRDYIEEPRNDVYQSLHIALYDNAARSNIEMQIRTQHMDDMAEIGSANHKIYEKQQAMERIRREDIEEGEYRILDEALERVYALQNLDLSKVDVNMFTAIDNRVMNDHCGLMRGRLILPYEHLSRFQNDIIG